MFSEHNASQPGGLSVDCVMAVERNLDAQIGGLESRSQLANFGHYQHRWIVAPVGIPVLLAVVAALGVKGTPYVVRPQDFGKVDLNVRDRPGARHPRPAGYFSRL